MVVYGDGDAVEWARKGFGDAEDMESGGEADGDLRAGGKYSPLELMVIFLQTWD